MEDLLLHKRMDRDGNNRVLNTVRPGTGATIDDTPESQVSLLSTAQQADS
jgi:hypothetical protein